MRTLWEIRAEAHRYDCEVVTQELLADMRRTNSRLAEAESQLRQVAALRLVCERRDWRGKLARRWVKRTQTVLGELARATDPSVMENR